MFRGTTPTLQFEIPVTVDEVDCLYITIAQNGITVIEKSLNDCECENKNIRCKLTQADTLKLVENSKTCIQVRIKTVHGDALASLIRVIRTDQILKDGEI